MTRQFLVALALLMLAGCGVDGEPLRPKLNTTVNASSGGHTSLGVGVNMGNVSVGTTGSNVNVGVGLGL